jgi:hypothetical protein
MQDLHSVLRHRRPSSCFAIAGSTVKVEQLLGEED